MRNISPDALLNFSSSHVDCYLAADLEFESGTVRFWTGHGELIWNGNVYTGGGNLIGISTIQETQDIQARGLVVSLNGVPTSIISISLNERYRGRPFKLYLGYVENESILLEDGFDLLYENEQEISIEGYPEPYQAFMGLMDVMEYSTDGKSADIQLSVENILIVGQRSKIGRYTHEDQRKTYPEDNGLKYINQLQDKEVVW